jgi:ornithine cyclodeaminase
MKFIDAETAESLFGYHALIDSLDRQHRQSQPLMDDLFLEQPGKSDVAEGFLLRAAWLKNQALGVKLATLFPDNHNAGLPSVQGAYVLFDGTNGTPQAVIDGTVLTWYKTAADSALGARYLARDDVDTMLMAGAGALAPHLIQAHCAIRPSIRRVLLWNRTAARAKALAEELAGSADLAGVAIEVVSDVEKASGTAALISCATMASAPLIKGEWLQSGTHLDLVGAYTPTMRETDDNAMQRGRIYVDARETTLQVTGELAMPLASGVIKEKDILGDLFELCSAKVSGRQNNQDITIFKNGGGGHLDLMTALFLLQRFTEKRTRD